MGLVFNATNNLLADGVLNVFGQIGNFIGSTGFGAVLVGTVVAAFGLGVLSWFRK